MLIYEVTPENTNYHILKLLPANQSIIDLQGRTPQELAWLSASGMNWQKIE